MSALGYYVPGEQAQIDIQFLPHLEGYIWIFPRCGHLSVGICGKGEPAASLRKRLEQYMTRRGISWKGASFYSHLLPSLDTGSWRTNRVAGDGWMAVGDAAGLVDPITGEGLYYAIRSADLAARALLSEAGDLAGRRTTASCCGAISRPTWNSARGWPSACSWADSCRVGARAHGAVHAPQPALLRHHAGPVRRQAALPGTEAPAAAKSQRQPVRDRHEPRVQPPGAGKAVGEAVVGIGDQVGARGDEARGKQHPTGGPQNPSGSFPCGSASKS